MVPYLSTNEVAQAVGMTTARIRQMAIAGQITAEKFGNVWLFDPREVERIKRTPKVTGRPRKGESTTTSSR